MRPSIARVTGHGGRYAYPNCYSVWSGMKSRCSNPKMPNYRLYGGRGISVCERWQSFANFYADMGDRPEGMSLDRIDRDGNYEPGNCRWATEATQHRNKSQNRWLRIGERTQTLGDWATEAGLNKTTLRTRVEMGWPESRLLSAPRRKRAQK